MLNKGGWDPNIILNDKLLVRQTGDRIIATIDYKNYYHLNNLHSFNKTNSKLELEYLLAIINSKLMSGYYLLTTLEKGRTMAQTDIETLEKLPIKISRNAREFEKLVKQMMNLNKKYYSESAHFIKERLAKQIQDTDYEIDQLVYKLYRLSDKEIKIVEDSFK